MQTYMFILRKNETSFVLGVLLFILRGMKLSSIYLVLLSSPSWAAELPQVPHHTDAQLAMMNEEELCKEIFSPCLAMIMLGKIPAAAIEVERNRKYLDTLRLYARQKRGHMPWWDREITKAVIAKDTSMCTRTVLQCDVPAEQPEQVLELE